MHKRQECFNCHFRRTVLRNLTFLLICSFGFNGNELLHWGLNLSCRMNFSADQVHQRSRVYLEGECLHCNDLWRGQMCQLYIICGFAQTVDCHCITRYPISLKEFLLFMVVDVALWVWANEQGILSILQRERGFHSWAVVHDHVYRDTLERKEQPAGDERGLMQLSTCTTRLHRHRLQNGGVAEWGVWGFN